MVKKCVDNVRKTFTSKVLLFGEYSAIKHSKALCMPYPLFEGQLSFRRGAKKLIDLELKALCQFLQNAHDKKEIPFEIDLKSF